VSGIFWNESLSAVEALQLENTTIFTGHGPGGLVAKGMASYFKALGVAFESAKYHGSLFSVQVERSSSAEDPSLPPEYQPDLDHRFLNVSPSGIIPSFLEETSATNIRFPSRQTTMQLSTPYHTLCYIAAACVSHDRFDHLCSSAIGMDEYEEYFRAWDRDRE
jgi:hypothetical protein